ncbi:MAG: adenylosuccinate lyase [Thermoplasmata archaeon]|nr:adenylosuccinate lyase [Thermoplasmata archaeon]
MTSLVCPIDYRYGREKMKSIFSEDNRLHTLLRVEAALAEAHAAVGGIPKDAPAKIWKAIDSGKVKLERVKEIEAEIRHDLMAIVRALSEQCGDAGNFIHLGATSYDIIDTANALQLKAAISVLREDLGHLEATLAELAERHKGLVMIGRTHGQFAVPITLGLKLAVFAMEVHRHLERLTQAEPRICAGKMSGATGSMAALGEHALEIQEFVMKKLDLTTEEAATQIVQRDRMTEYVLILSNISASIEKFATEIRNLQRSEILEIAESFDVQKQVGSSAMAHKQNPITCENICGLARIIRGFVTPAFENMPTWHERDLTNSSAERFILPHVSILTDDILVKMEEVFRDMRVFPENIRRNLEMSKGLPMAESVMMALTKKGMGRQEAHEVVRQCSMVALKEQCHLRDALMKDERITSMISQEEIEEALRYENYTGKSKEIVEKVVGIIRE